MIDIRVVIMRRHLTRTAVPLDDYVEALKAAIRERWPDADIQIRTSNATLLLPSMFGAWDNGRELPDVEDQIAALARDIWEQGNWEDAAPDA